MKLMKIFSMTLAVLVLAVSVVSCTTGGTGKEDGTVTEGVTEPMTDPSLEWTAATEYVCQDESVLRTYADMSPEQFDLVCRYYEGQGYQVYSQSVKAGNHFATYVKDSAMAHIYLYTSRQELNIVTSDTAATTLPPAVPEVTSGTYETSVTQIKDAAHINGMGYVIQLADGSFIIYDGAYVEQHKRLYNTLVAMSEGLDEIVIRAWVITHAHDDHYPTFGMFGKRYGTQVTLERLIIAPIAEEIAFDNYLNTTVHEDLARYEGAELVYAHSGMEFTFCNLKMEVLFAADDVYRNQIPDNFNTTSLVTRLYDSQGYSMLVLGDATITSTTLMQEVYGDYLKSNICQVAHHGVEDVTLSFYETVQANILFYPCMQSLYDMEGRNSDVRKALETKPYTKEILIAGNDQYVRSWGTVFTAE